MFPIISCVAQGVIVEQNKKAFGMFFELPTTTAPLTLCVRVCVQERGGGASDDQSLEQSVLSRYNGFCELEGSAIQFIYKP